MTVLVQEKSIENIVIQERSRIKTSNLYEYSFFL